MGSHDAKGERAVGVCACSMKERACAWLACVLL